MRLMLTAEGSTDAFCQLIEGFHARVVEGSNRIADGLVVAAKELGYCRSPFASCTGQQDLATAHSEGVW